MAFQAAMARFKSDRDEMLSAEKLSSEDFSKFLGDKNFAKFRAGLASGCSTKWYLRKMVNPLPNKAGDDCENMPAIIVIKVKEDSESKVSHHCPRLGITEAPRLAYMDPEAFWAPALVDLKQTHEWKEVAGYPNVFVLRIRASKPDDAVPGEKRAAEEEASPEAKRARTDDGPDAAAAPPADSPAAEAAVPAAAPAPAAAPEAAPAAAPAATTPGFNFGATAASAPASSGGFTFGAAAPAGASGFAFTAPAPAAGFTFGTGAAPAGGAAPGFDFSGGASAAFSAAPGVPQVNDEEDPTWPLLPDDAWAAEKRLQLATGNLIIYRHVMEGQATAVPLKVNDLKYIKMKAPERKKFVVDGFLQWALRQQDAYKQLRKDFEDANVHLMTPEKLKELETESKKKTDDVRRGDGVKALLATVKDEQGKALSKLNEISLGFKSHDEEQRSLITAINAAQKAKLQVQRSDVTIDLFYPDDIEGRLRPSKKIGQLGTADTCFPEVQVIINPLTGLPMPGAN